MTPCPAARAPAGSRRWSTTYRPPSRFDAVRAARARVPQHMDVGQRKTPATARQSTYYHGPPKRAVTMLTRPPWDTQHFAPLRFTTWREHGRGDDGPGQRLRDLGRGPEHHAQPHPGPGYPPKP